MPLLSVLVVDNEKEWRDEISEILKGLTVNSRGKGTSLVKAVSSVEEALTEFSATSYDLAITDLALKSVPANVESADELGLYVIEQLRRSSANPSCACILFTAFATSDRTQRALQESGANLVVRKQDFSTAQDPESFLLGTAHRVLRLARLRTGLARTNEHLRLIASCDLESWTGVELVEQGHTTHPGIRPIHDPRRQEWARRGNNLSYLLGKRWRDEAKDLGSSLFQSAFGAPAARELLGAARLRTRSANLEFHLRGPSESLSLPFELLWDGSNHIALHHPISHEVTFESVQLRRSVEPLAVFVERVQKQKQSLSVLLVAANPGGELQGAEREVRLLKRQIKAELAQVAFDVEIRTLTGKAASRERLKAELEKHHFHILHFAGHGYFETDHPEKSGLVLRSGAGVGVLSASDLSMLAAESDLHLAFFSCCRSGASASQLHQGDFFGLFDAMSRAGVPAALGYRWPVSDEAAIGFATEFYRALWKNFSPADATLEARRKSAQTAAGLDDPTWASPVLVLQTP